MPAQSRTPSGVLRALFGMLAFSVLAGVLVTVMVTPAVAVTGMAATTSVDVFNDLPNYIEIGQQAERNRFFGVKNDGSEVQIATTFSQNREEVDWDQTSAFAKQAAMSGEDRHFYDHGGVDLPSLARAAIQNSTSDGIQSGASTLTMQLVKNIYIMQAIEANPLKGDDASYKAQQKAIQDAQAATIDRKLRDMRMAIALEKKYSKDQILQAYLNIAGFGSANTYGIEAAAERYYNTNAKDLNLAQATSLVAIVQSPTKRGLQSDSTYAANKSRRDEILGRMLTDSKDGTAKFPITQAQYDEAIKTPVDASTVHLTDPANGCVAAEQYSKWACVYLTALVPTLPQLGSTQAARNAAWTKGGYDIHTSFNVDLNQVATEADKRYVNPADTRAFIAAASTSVQVGTGWVVTMAQNQDYRATQDGPPGTTSVNYNTPQQYGGSTGFQPGSTFKVFTLINWLKSGHGVNEVVDVTPKQRNQADYNFGSACWTKPNGGWGGPYQGKNSSGETGRRTVLESTKQSINNGFFEMAKQLDNCATEKEVQAFGVTRGNGQAIDWTGAGLASIIGSGSDNVAPLTMAAAYAGVAGQGNFCKPIIVKDIVDGSGKDLGGQTPECQQVEDAGVMAGVTYALNQAYANGSYPSRDPSTAPMIGKTGTTDNSATTWVIESSTKVATATWVGQYKAQSVTNGVPKYASITNLGLFNARHSIAKVINKAVNDVFGGDAFPKPDNKYISGGNQPTIPSDIIGATPTAATAELEALGFDVDRGGTVASDQPAGTVASSDPSPGSRASLGTSVTIYISDGSQAPITVPDVVSGNPPLAQAAAQLQQAGFTSINQQCQAVSNGNGNGGGNGPGNGGGGNGGTGNNAQNLNGRVLSVSPAVGSQVPKTTPVTLAVAQSKCS